MQAKKILVALVGVGLSTLSLAYTPQASADKYGLFLDSSQYSIPTEFWHFEDNENRVLLPKGKTSGKDILSVPSFKNALGGTFAKTMYSPIDEHIENQKYLGYPSIYEYGTNNPVGSKKLRTDFENQCVSFAKMMLRNSTGTGQWYADTKTGTVMSQKHQGSDVHRGKAIIFMKNTAVSYKQQTSDAHVAIFLGYSDNGFWVADENFTGTGLKPTGEIRKHFIKTITNKQDKKFNSAHNADKYYFLDIR